jgi:hypothetical protein
MSPTPIITFGMIVLNGEPFIKYNLRALYPFAHQIIVVEGASPYAHDIATPDGHSTDGTLDALRNFKRDEDPSNKIQIVIAEDEGYPNGFWPGEKLEQSQAYAKRATGNWLWQVDVDEFYMPKDMAWICENLLKSQHINAISFKQIQFWGGIEYLVDGWYLRHWQGEVFHRLFRWQLGFVYANHRPPTVLDEMGNDLRKQGWITARELERRQIFLYHYSLVFPHQVNYKSTYYSNVGWGTFPRMKLWVEQNYLNLHNPFRVHNTYQYPSWLERYSGTHPQQVQTMWKEIQAGHMEPNQIRTTNDIELLLNSPVYIIGKIFLKITGPLVWSLQVVGQRLFAHLPKQLRFFVKQFFVKVRSLK